MSTAPIPPHIAAIEQPREGLMTYYALKAVAAAVALPFVFPNLYFRFHYDALPVRDRWHPYEGHGHGCDGDRALANGKCC
jgi:hypothetical protein